MLDHFGEHLQVVDQEDLASLDDSEHRGEGRDVAAEPGDLHVITLTVGRLRHELDPRGERLQFQPIGGARGAKRGVREESFERAPNDG